MEYFGSYLGDVFLTEFVDRERYTDLPSDICPGVGYLGTDNGDDHKSSQRLQRYKPRDKACLESDIVVAASPRLAYALWASPASFGRT